mgnify:CR=1 FL=1
MKIRRAVFPVAGLGTRFLPATKAMPKELLPIVDKPLIQYAVEEAIEAGIDTLIFVTGRNKRAIEDHFDANNELEAVLRASGRDDQADMIRDILPRGVECIFVRQAKQLGLGHAVLCAERAVGKNAFAVLLADDFITDKTPGVTTELASYFYDTGKSQLSVVEVDGPEISKYGVIVPSNKGRGVSGLIEKPDVKNAPSNIASIGRYVLTTEIFKTLKQLSPGSGGEIQLADAINILAGRGCVEFVKFDGRRFDCGSVDGFIAASIHEYAKR